jgi:hypothetical protein
MKKIVKVLCLGALFIGMGTIANAQLRQSVYINGNIPTGDFASSASDGPVLIAAYNTGVPLTYEQIGKDATLGFGFGYRASYRFDVGVGLVAPYANVDFLWNTISSKWSEKYSDAYMSSPTYFNIPLLVGVTYIYDEMPWNDISLFGEFGIGTDFFLITSEGSSDNIKLAYKSTFAFAWQLVVGAFFGEHVSVGLHYYGLGTHNIDYTSGTREDVPAAAAQQDAGGRQRRSVGSLMLRIGFHF